MTIDGYRLHQGMLGAARALAAARRHLDAINVFPVADADTGTNLSATLNGAVTDAEPDAAVGVVARRLADAALFSSVGNSGIILAQFLDGFADGLRGREQLDAAGLAAAARRAVEHAYQALSEPREGTILSVMQVWAEALGESAAGDDVAGLIEAALPAVRTAVARTQAQLAVLAEAGVPDAGAEGFVVLLGGLHRGLVEADAAPAEAAADDAAMALGAHAEPVPTEPPIYRYCTEIIVEQPRGEAATLRAALDGLGDSLIVAGRSGRLKVHLHCDAPDEAAARLGRFGSLGPQKVDDMALQHASHRRPLADIAVVTDSACDLPRSLLDRWQIHQVPLSIHWDADQFLDRQTLTAAQFYDQLGRRQVHPTTSQPSPQRLDRVYRVLADSHRAILSVHLSGRLSGTVDAARSAARRLTAAPVHVRDARQISTALGLIVLAAAEAVADGADADTVIRLIDDLAVRTEILVAVQSLDAMIRSGRVGALKGFVARRLGLLPIVSLDRDGRSCVRGKARSFDGAVERIIERIARRARSGRAERWALAHAAAEPVAETIAERLGEVLGMAPDYLMETSPMLGAHAGLGSVCVAVQWSA